MNEPGVRGTTPRGREEGATAEAPDAPRVAEDAKRPDAGPVTVVADVNEPRELVERVLAAGVPVARRRLAPADYVVGAAAIERKTVRDFHRSLVDKRLFEQLVRLKDAYPDPVILLLEGDLAFAEGLKQPRAFWGALVAATVDVGVTVLPTTGLERSADVLATLARRMGATRRDGVVRFKPRMLGASAEQRFCVQGLPGVGDVGSERLLERFGSVRRVFAASERDFLRTPGIGPKRARAIAEFLDRPHEGAQERLDAEDA